MGSALRQNGKKGGAAWIIRAAFLDEIKKAYDNGSRSWPT